MKIITCLRKVAFASMGFMLFSGGLNAQTLVWSAEAENYDEVTNTNTKITYQEDADCYMSGCAFVENISPNSYFTYKNVQVAEAGTYELYIHYTMVDVKGRGVGITVLPYVRDTIWLTEQTGTWSGAPAIDPETELPIPGTEGTIVAKKLIYLNAGANTIRIGGSGDGYAPNFDKFEIYTTTQTIEKPEEQKSAWHWDYTDEAINVTSDNSVSIKNLIDNKAGTIYKVPGVKTANIDFEFEYPMAITGFLIYSGDFNKKINLDLIEVKGSNDKESWVNAGKAETTGLGFAQVVGATNLDSGFKYIRLQFETESNDVEIGEFQLFGYPKVGETVIYPEDLIQVSITGEKGEKVATGLNGSFSTSSNGLESYGEVAANAVDGIRNKFTISGKSYWIQYDFNDETLVSSYSLAIGATSNMDRNPKSWKLLASADWGTTWDVIAEVNDFVYPACTYNNMKFNVDKPKSDYLYYRIEIQNNGGDMSHISEYQLHAAVLPTMPSDDDSSITPEVVEKAASAVVYTDSEGIVIKPLAEGGSYKVYSITGSLVKIGNLNSTEKINLQKGVYIVEVISLKNVSNTTKVIVH